MPDLVITVPHLAWSFSIVTAKSPDEPPTIRQPELSRCSFNAVARNARDADWLICETIASGTPVGTISPSQASPSRAGYPLSATVGVSGSNWERLELVTTIALSLPALT